MNEWIIRAICPDTYEGPGTVTTIHGTREEAQAAVDEAAAEGWIDPRAEGPLGTVLTPTA